MVSFRIASTSLLFKLMSPASAFSPNIGITTTTTRRRSTNIVYQHDGITSRLKSSQEDFVEKQKKVSSSNEGETDPSPSIRSYLDHQRAVFDDMSDYFNTEEATLPEIEPILDYLVKKALIQSSSSISSDLQNNTEEESKKVLKVLDVGCGTGALFSSYIKAADELGITLDIKGVDLSPKMISYAQENAKMLVQQDDDKHAIDCEMGDFVQKVLGLENSPATLVGFDGGVVEGTEGFRDSVVTAASTSLKEGGVFVIGHPLGAQFVEKLRKENPSTVPNGLPSREEFDDVVQFQQLEVMDFEEEIDIDGDGKKAEMYYASAVKKTHRMLRDVVRVRGVVDVGYGRGGKKLGVPTANLPASLFADALSNVPTGVYIGAAVIEGSSDEKLGRGVVHKAVVNVGYSPTFDGAENKEKIVEAHLIIDEGALEGDFYGETMRLALSGFLRPEMKFPSFPDLIKAIRNDVQNAKDSLDIHPYSTFAKHDPFLIDCKDVWVGKSGGDEEASYEFASTTQFLSEHTE
eukprot:scaffold6156_cov243-Chaetoceros_neogracile.AAC.4